MAITVRGERASERSRDGNSDEVTYRRQFIVETDNDDIGPRAVSFATGLPVIGELHPESGQCRVVNRIAQQISGARRLWTVECQYSNKHDDPENEDNKEEDNQDALTETPEVEVGFEQRRVAVTGEAKPLFSSIGGPAGGRPPLKGVTNSAGEPFDPPPEIDVGHPFIRVTRTEININLVLLMTYENSVNQFAWLGAQPRCVRMTGINARRVYKKGFRYWRVSYTLTYIHPTAAMLAAAVGGWDLQLLDIGSHYWDGEEMKHFVTDDNPPQPRFGLLNGAGGPLLPGGEVHYMNYSVYRETNFALLNLEPILA